MCNLQQSVCVTTIVQYYFSGSTLITLTVEGSTVGVTNSINGLCDQVENSKTFVFDGVNVSPEPYLTVDGNSYYGVQCGPVSK